MSAFEISKYLDLKAAVVGCGYGHEIDWTESLELCIDADTFAMEYCWVVLNAGMKEQVARGIWDRLRPLLEAGQSLESHFRHMGKREALETGWSNRAAYFDAWVRSEHSIDYLETLPWIGPVTKFHLAKNLGLQFCKPDRHLMRIADAHDTTPAKLCEEVSAATGDRITTVDMVLWRAANLGFVVNGEST